MRINGNNKVLSIYQSSIRDIDAKVHREEKRDKVEISKEALEYGKIMEKLREIPDVREEKVERLKAEIEAGTYKIDSKKIANKMVDDANLINRINSW